LEKLSFQNNQECFRVENEINNTDFLRNEKERASAHVKQILESKNLKIEKIQQIIEDIEAEKNQLNKESQSQSNILASYKQKMKTMVSLRFKQRVHNENILSKLQLYQT